jgi:hypothetical protein
LFCLIVVVIIAAPLAIFTVLFLSRADPVNYMWQGETILYAMPSSLFSSGLSVVSSPDADIPQAWTPVKVTGRVTCSRSVY